MGFFESINRAFFNLTYNEKASAAYDEQNEKAAGAVDDIKKQIDGYRKARDRLLAANKATDYYASNSLARITEWENWIGKNGGLAAGDYTQKSTEMKTQWESITSANKIVEEVERIPAFLDLFLKDKDTKIPNQERKDILKLKQQSEDYLKGINKQTPADIVAKRDTFNADFMEIQKKIPENFEDLKEGFQAGNSQLTLLQGINETSFNDYKNQVEQKELAEEDTFQTGRLLRRILEYFNLGFGTVWPFVFGAILAMIVANDMIGRKPLYRFFYFAWTFLLCQVSLLPGFSIVLTLYYFYRAFVAINWGNVFTFEPSGPMMDYMKAPVLFAFLPLLEGGKNLPWYLSIVHFDPNLYDGLAQKKKIAYEMAAGLAVGKQLDPSMLNIEERTLDDVLSDMKSSLLGIQTTPLTNLLADMEEALAAGKQVDPSMFKGTLSELQSSLAGVQKK